MYLDSITGTIEKTVFGLWRQNGKFSSTVIQKQDNFYFPFS